MKIGIVVLSFPNFSLMQAFLLLEILLLLLHLKKILSLINNLTISLNGRSIANFLIEKSALQGKLCYESINYRSRF